MALALPFVLVTATPAQAVTAGGCSVTPHTPAFAGFYSSGVKQIRYNASLTCTSAGTLKHVEIDQLFYEDDDTSADDYLGSKLHVRDFYTSGSSLLEEKARPLPNTEGGNEEVYHMVRLRVTSNGVTSWSGWHRSPNLSIAN